MLILYHIVIHILYLVPNEILYHLAVDLVEEGAALEDAHSA